MALAGIGILVFGLIFLNYQSKPQVLGITETSYEKDASLDLITPEDIARSILLTDSELGTLLRSEGVELKSLGEDPKGQGWLFQVNDVKGETLLWALVDKGGKVKIL